jgi:hypothetical protein
LETWYLAVFQKKLVTKLFIFKQKKKLSLNSFILSFGPRVHFQGKKLIFWQKKIRPKTEEFAVAAVL